MKQKKALIFSLLFVFGCLICPSKIVYAVSINDVSVNANQVDEKQEKDMEGTEGADIELITEDSGVEGFVRRLYNICLDREPEQEGMAYWINGLKSGEFTGANAAYGFIFSKEFKSKNLCNSDYVEYLYKAFMGRDSDDAGKSYWITNLESGYTREHVFNEFVLSKEFNLLCDSYGIRIGSAVKEPQYGTLVRGKCDICGKQDGVTTFAARMYSVCLDRTPDEDGLFYWCNILWDHSMDGAEVAYGFVFSDEFKNKKLCNEDFVEYMYKAFFGRASDYNGKDYWLSRMKEGYSREYIFAGFASSKEFENLCNECGIKVDTKGLLTRLTNLLPIPGIDNYPNDTQGWVYQYSGQPTYGCHRVLNNYYFERDCSAISEDEDINNFTVTVGTGSNVQYTIVENQDFNSNGYNLGDYRKFSYRIQGINESEEFTYLNGYDVRNALVNGKMLSSYSNDEEEWYSYSLKAVPNYQNAIADVEVSTYKWAASGAANYKGPSNATFQLNFPSGCVDGSFKVDVFYDSFLIDSFTVESKEGTIYAKAYDSLSKVDPSLTIRDKLFAARDHIRVSYKTNCIGGSQLISHAARHLWGLPVGYVMNVPSFEGVDENNNYSRVVNTGTVLGPVKFYAVGYVNNKLIKNPSYVQNDSFRGNVGSVYTHMATVIYYENSWWYWNAEGYAAN